ncbi:MAG: NAD-dependent deacylase [Bacteroidota bacterium]
MSKTTKKKHIVVLTGAGMSAESGIKTFRDNDGLWENHDVMEVATPEAFARNPSLVQRFYNQRRAQLKEVEPNRGHFILAELEAHFKVDIVTQNVDNLHERAGSTRVLHLHGELTKVRSVAHPQLIYEWTGDVTDEDRCERGAKLRPHIVWFGEAVPMLGPAAVLVSAADVVVIVGTSMQVYPAAGLVGYARAGMPVYYIDPKPHISFELKQKLEELDVIEKGASEGLELLRNHLMKEMN